jgi:transcription elongation GreA/GreB family factor
MGLGTHPAAAAADATCSHARIAVPSPARHAGDMTTQAHTMSLDEALERTQRAGPGSTVEVVDRAGRRTIYEIVTQPPCTAPRPVTLDSAEGLALLGARRGDALTIRAENGRPRRVSVIAVTAAAASRGDGVLPA